MVGLFGLAQRFLNRPGPALSYLTEAIFPYYVLHQTITLSAGYFLARSGVGVWVEATGLTLAAVLGCVLLHELVIRRVRLLRPLFGLKWK